MPRKPALEQAVFEMLGRDDSPPAMRAREIADALGLPRAERAQLRLTLQQLVTAGRLVMIEGRRFGLASSLGDVVGVYRRRPAGFGFVIPEGEGQDLYVAAEAERGAMHGDLVLARIEEVREDGRVRGRVMRVLERRSRSLLGTFERTLGGGGIVEPLEDGYGFDVVVPRDGVGAAVTGEIVRVELESLPHGAASPRGKVVERLGKAEEPGVDVEIVIRRHGLRPDFPAEVLEEAAACPGPDDWDLTGREDFTHEPVVTIDGADAKDFDDAISVERRGDGGFALRVHIADVAHFVREGGALDQEALSRAASVYLPGRVVPMLPPRLSEELCSLRPGTPRLVQGVTLLFDATGRVTDATPHRGVIRSAARLTYDGVEATLERRGDHPPLEPRIRAMLEDAAELARRLIVRRGARGAVDIDLPEVRIELDDDGRTKAIDARPRLLAHRMIEEFMIAANVAIAGWLRKRRQQSLFRVHEKPDPMRLSRLSELLDGLGYTLPEPGPKGLPPRVYAEIAGLALGRPEERAVHRWLLRSMALARYDAECLGHFGLALPRYLHFTSPIRRYPDLVVHRDLARLLEKKRERGGERAERLARLPELAVECSRLERVAEGAEREAIQWKVTAFMGERIGEEYDARIVDVLPHGLSVGIEDPYVEGLVPIERLGGEGGFRYDPRKRRLLGRGDGRNYRLGQELRVRVDRVDLLRGFIDFSPVDAANAPRGAKGKSKGGGKAKAKAQPKKKGGGRSGKGGGRTRGKGRR